MAVTIPSNPLILASPMSNGSNNTVKVMLVNKNCTLVMKNNLSLVRTTRSLQPTTVARALSSLVDQLALVATAYLTSALVRLRSCRS
jgi:hypothetical protein